MSQYKCFSKDYTHNTNERLEFITVTSQIEEAIFESGIQNGSIVIQSHHTTARLWVNEDEKNLIGRESELGYEPDMKRILDRFAHPDEEYGHNDIADVNNPNGKRNTHLCDPDSCGIIHECINGHAHAQAMILPVSLSMIVHDGKLLKGRWQEIMFVELDHDRTRTFTVMVQGI